MLGYALTFLVLAFGASLLGTSEISGAAAHVTWLALVTVFVLTLVVAVGVGWFLDRDRVWRSGERDRQLLLRAKAIGLDLERFLTALEGPNKSPKVVTLKRAPGTRLPSGRLPNNSDYQGPYQPPRRVSDAEPRSN